MLELLKSLTLENLVDIAGILGFIMSLTAWIYTLHSNRVNLKVSIYDIKSFEETTFLNMLFVNNSKLPISITNISVIINDRTIKCTTASKIIYENVRKSGKEILGVDIQRSASLPIQIQALNAVREFILFENLQELPKSSATHLTFLISTNRGKLIEKSLQLPAEWAHRRSIFE